jgi:hypothetical protein
MLEDDSRYFPMATTDFLQRIRTSERYQNIARVDALFKAITHATEVLSAEPDYTVEWFHVDLFNHRLHLAVFDLVRGMWIPAVVESMEGRISILTVESVQSTITPRHPRDTPVLFGMIDCLRRYVDQMGPSWNTWTRRDLDPKILLRDSKESRSRFLVNLRGVDRIPPTEVEDIHEHDHCPPPTNSPLFEEHFIKDIGKSSAISSSKQQPLLAVLDELYYRCSTEDV